MTFDIDGLAIGLAHPSPLHSVISSIGSLD